MTTRAGKTKRKSPVTANGRRRGRPAAARGALIKSKADQVKEQRPPADDPSASQDTRLKVIIYFLWRVCKDKEALDSLTRLMRYAILLVTLLLTPVILVSTMPAPWPWRVIPTGGATTVIAIITIVKRWRKKRRPSPLAAVLPAACPAHPITAAQETDGGLGKHNRGGGESSGNARPHQDANTTGKRNGSPCADRRRHHTGFRPVGEQRQPVAAAFRVPRLPGSVRGSQAGPGWPVSAHLAGLVIREGRYEVAWS